MSLAYDVNRILLAHGEGGRLMRRLIRERILTIFQNPSLAALGDAAALPPIDGALAFTTDSFVVSPLFFPGGDIGSLAVFGTVNDLAVSGARPLWLSASLIIEEGLPLADFDRILSSAAQAAASAGVSIVTGDTKVVPTGAADRLFITTSGVGKIIFAQPPHPRALMPGDQVLATGVIGQHGIAILAAREDLRFSPPVVSDSASLWPAVAALHAAKIPVRAMRDATRGGVAAVLHEWAEASAHTLFIDEPSVPVSPQIQAACELLGLDPLHVANEGTMLVAIPPHYVDAAIMTLRSVACAAKATIIGEVREREMAPVIVRRAMGNEQPLDEPTGAPMPRIC